ncbi:unnamed protein product [Paramecium sonneborni]|uniref:Uncharacterized protein n=1 Tax=Paramecium sonneborni TaxID=65129 RepID=A0A8S1PFP9_9CILI|nr:unnamed protein product [Paramecium sonneborni]
MDMEYQLHKVVVLLKQNCLIKRFFYLSFNYLMMIAQHMKNDRQLIFTVYGKMVVWSLEDKQFPLINKFKVDSQVPNNLKIRYTLLFVSECSKSKQKLQYLTNKRKWGNNTGIKLNNNQI